MELSIILEVPCDVITVTSGETREEEEEGEEEEEEEEAAEMKGEEVRGKECFDLSKSWTF